MRPLRPPALPRPEPSNPTGSGRLPLKLLRREGEAATEGATPARTPAKPLVRGELARGTPSAPPLGLGSGSGLPPLLPACPLRVPPLDGSQATRTLARPPPTLLLLLACAAASVGAGCAAALAASPPPMPCLLPGASATSTSQAPDPAEPKAVDGRGVGLEVCAALLSANTEATAEPVADVRGDPKWKGGVGRGAERAGEPGALGALPEARRLACEATCCAAWAAEGDWAGSRLVLGGRAKLRGPRAGVRKVS